MAGFAVSINGRFWVSTEGVPALLFRSGVPYVEGRCFSCGDALQRFRVGRCWRCSLAWRLACRVAMPAPLADALDAARAG